MTHRRHVLFYRIMTDVLPTLKQWQSWHGNRRPAFAGRRSCAVPAKPPVDRPEIFWCNQSTDGIVHPHGRKGNMNTDAYKAHLQTQEISAQEIADRLHAAQALEDGLREFGTDLASAGKPDTGRIAGQMIVQGINTLRQFEMLAEYARTNRFRRKSAPAA
jgi:hypothetical protein